MPGLDPGGIVITILIGVAGAFLGGFLARCSGSAASPSSGRRMLA